MKFQSGDVEFKEGDLEFKEGEDFGGRQSDNKGREASCAKAKGTSGWGEVLWRKI